jgi:hypothetical protein
LRFNHAYHPVLDLSSSSGLGDRRRGVCEGHKEVVIEAFGIDHFPIRRLSESDEVFRTGGRFSRRHKADEKKRGRHASKE